jgi:hypothetical protein
MARLKSILPEEQQDPQSAILPERVAKLIEFYNKNNVQYPWTELDKQEQLFDFRRKLRNDTYTYKITSLYRVRDPAERKKEYYFYEMSATCLNENGGTEYSGSHTYGYIKEPIHKVEYVDRQKKYVPVKKQDNPIYLFKWDKEQVAKLMDGSESPWDVNMYVATGERRGQATDLGATNLKAIKNRNDFLDLDFDDLLIVNRSPHQSADEPLGAIVKDLKKERFNLVREDIKKEVPKQKGSL